MVKCRPVVEKLREQHAFQNDGDAIPSWLKASYNSPSRFQDIAPPASPLPTSSAPATPPHLRKHIRPSTRKPLQPSNGNQGPPKSNRKMNNREHMFAHTPMYFNPVCRGGRDRYHLGQLTNS